MERFGAMLMLLLTSVFLQFREIPVERGCADDVVGYLRSIAMRIQRDFSKEVELMMLVTLYYIAVFKVIDCN